jgi:nucleoside-triphosphatase THEP1
MVVLLSGPVHGGKTTLLERRLPLWADRGLACAGFLSPAAKDAGLPAGYDLFEIATGRRRPYLRLSGDAAAERIGPYVFVPEALERARTIIREEAGAAGLLVIDEVGPLELLGGGLWPALGPILSARTGTTLLVVRESLVPGLTDRLGPPAPAVFDVRDPRVLERLDGCLSEQAASHDRHR